MKVKAILNYLRIAPRKVRLLTNLIQGKKVEEARAILNFSLKRGSRPLLKLLESAVASARHNFRLEEESLWISEVRVDEGPKLKRWRARARGRAAEIQKKTCHITLILSGEEKKITKPKEEVSERGETREGKAKPKPEIPKAEKEITPTKSQISRKRIFRRKSF